MEEGQAMRVARAGAAAAAEEEDPTSVAAGSNRLTQGQEAG